MFLFVRFVEISTILIRDGKKKTFLIYVNGFLRLELNLPVTTSCTEHIMRFKKAAYIQVFKWKL